MNTEEAGPVKKRLNSLGCVECGRGGGHMTVGAGTRKSIHLMSPGFHREHRCVASYVLITGGSRQPSLEGTQGSLCRFSVSLHHEAI